jgi:hypothetical protein
VEYTDWGRLLSERFPVGDIAAVEREWTALKQRVAVGQPVRGVVFAKAPFWGSTGRKSKVTPRGGP